MLQVGATSKAKQDNIEPMLQQPAPSKRMGVLELPPLKAPSRLPPLGGLPPLKGGIPSSLATSGFKIGSIPTKTNDAKRNKAAEINSMPSKKVTLKA